MMGWFHFRMYRIIFLSAVTLLAALLNGCIETQTRQEMMEKRILKHLQEIYKADEYQQIFKWPLSLEYNLHAVIIDAEDRKFEEYFPFIENLFNEIAVVSGLNITRVHDPEGLSNMHIFFTSDPYRVAMHPNVRMHMKTRKMTDAEYEQDIRQNIERKYPYFGRGHTLPVNLALEHEVNPVFSMNIINLNWVEPERRPGFLTQVIFDAVTFTGAQSDIVTPSITTKKHGRFKKLTTLTPFDRALLQALYSDEIQYGMPLTEALPLMARKMAQIMEESTNHE